MTSERNPPQPHTLSYRTTPVGAVLATEAAIAALARTRWWALLSAIVLFIAGGLGTLGGAWVAVVVIINRGSAAFAPAPNILMSAGGLVYGIASLVLGVLLVRFASAAGRTNALRRPEDLERAMVAQQWVWQWATLCLAAALAYPFIIMATAMAQNIWP